MLKNYARDVISALENNKYERTGTDAGIYVPKIKSYIRGDYVHDVNGLDERIDPNMLPDEGLMYLLTVGLYNGTKLATWYLSIYAANYTPLPGLTAASYPATASEITSSSEGYTESTRPLWVPSAPSANAISNLASKAAYTIATASTLTINGAVLVSESAKGAITGKLASATKFNAARTLNDTDTFNLAYRVSLVTD